MATTTPKSNNAKTKTQAKVKNSATSSPVKQPHSHVSGVGNTSVDISNMASDYILTTKHNNVPTLNAAIKNAHAKKKHEEMMALAEKLKSRIFPGEMSSETMDSVIADFIRNFAKDRETAIYLCNSVGWYNSCLPARLAFNIDTNTFKPMPVELPAQDINIFNSSSLITQHYLYPDFEILIETIDERWIESVLLSTGEPVPGQEGSNLDAARYAIMRSFSVLSDLPSGWNDFFRTHRTFEKNRFYRAENDLSRLLVVQQDSKKPFYQMLAILESGKVLSIDLLDSMIDVYINSTMSPFVYRQESLLIRRNISVKEIASMQLVSVAPGVGESKISYYDFLNTWKAVCDLYSYLTRNYDNYHRAFGIFGPVLTDDFSRFTLTREIPVSMTNAIRTLLNFGLFEYVADRVAAGINQLEATATKAV